MMSPLLFWNGVSSLTAATEGLPSKCQGTSRWASYWPGTAGAHLLYIWGNDLCYHSKVTLTFSIFFYPKRNILIRQPSLKFSRLIEDQNIIAADSCRISIYILYLASKASNRDRDREWGGPSVTCHFTMTRKLWHGSAKSGRGLVKRKNWNEKKMSRAPPMTPERPKLHSQFLLTWTLRRAKQPWKNIFFVSPTCSCGKCLSYLTTLTHFRGEIEWKQQAEWV